MVITIIEVAIFLAIIIFPILVPVNKKRQPDTKTEFTDANSIYAINQHGKLEKLNNVQYKD